MTTEHLEEDYEYLLEVGILAKKIVSDPHEIIYNRMARFARMIACFTHNMANKKVLV